MINACFVHDFHAMKFSDISQRFAHACYATQNHDISVRFVYTRYTIQKDEDHALAHCSPHVFGVA